jgi:AcrR family transcriptional regulator
MNSGQLSEDVRARSPSQKEGRRAGILAAAATVLVRDGWDGVRMEDVAAEAGVAKGTPYLYWDSRESLFLDLLAREYAAWFQVVVDGLPGVAATPEAVADLLVDSLLPRPALLELVGLLHVVLEVHAGPAAVARFKESLLVGGTAAAAALAAHLGGWSEERAVAFLLRVHAAIVAYRPMSSPPPVVAEVLAQPRFAPLRTTFAPALRSLFRDLLWAGGRSS